MAKQPKWTNPTRQTYLVTLFLRLRVFVSLDILNAKFQNITTKSILIIWSADWIADDRAQRQAEWQAEFEARHSTNERRYPLHGRFSAIGQGHLL